MAVDLQKYIDDARAKSASDEQIKAALINAGWREEQIMQSLSRKSASDSLLPPPPVPHTGMWVGFLYVLFFIALYVLATSLGIMFHQWVDQAIPDIKEGVSSSGITYASTFNQYIIQGCIASIIVAFPILFSLALVLRKQLAKNPAVRSLRSRKQFIYITLVITFLIMLCHVIGTIYSFLGGTLTMNASAHLGVTFLIAGSIFWYFIDEVKNDRKNVE